MLITKHRSALLRFLLILSLVVILLQPFGVYAHSGDTDSSGGHYDHENGGYHYHCGGHPAHQHPGGVCPYDGPVNKPSSGSGTGIGSSTGSNSGSSSTEDKYKNSDDDSIIFVYIIMAVVIILLLYYLYREFFPAQKKTLPTTFETEIFDPFPEIEPEPKTKPSTTLQRTPLSTSDSAVFTIPPKNPPKKETPMLQTTIYPSSKPPQTNTHSLGVSDELIKLKNGNEFLRNKVDKLNQQLINTNKENERLKRDIASLKEEHSHKAQYSQSQTNAELVKSLAQKEADNQKLTTEIERLKKQQRETQKEIVTAYEKSDRLLEEKQNLQLRYDKLSQQKQTNSNALLTKENEQLKREIAALKAELEQEKQRTNLELPNLQSVEDTPEYLKLPDENAYYDALRTTRTQKVSSGKLILKQLFGKMYSEYSKKTYTTTLDSCTCDDFHYRKKVCKHMLAFALEIKAVDLKK